MASQRLSTGTVEEREAALAAAVEAVADGDLIVLPTDTVYGVGCDAFSPASVQRLLDAKGRGRDMPPPVLIADAATLDAMIADVPGYVRTLAERFWPGPLTLVGRQQPSLRWDLGETRGTVAVRVPDHNVARELLERTGPLTVSSANTTGLPAATSAESAQEMLGEAVAVFVNAGTSPGGVASTILDVTAWAPRLLRAGAIPLAEVNEALAGLGISVEG